jgi:DNA-binding NarL/FixJ family response regulator
MVQPAKPGRILIVDDHPIVRSGYRQVIGCHADLEICGEAAGQAEAIERIHETRPDLAVVDLSLAQGHGIDLIKHIRAHFPQVKCLVVSAHDESLFAARSLHAGALGYLSKHEATDRLIDGIRTVLAGRVFLSDAAATRLLMRSVGQRPTSDRSLLDCLSDRELAVFQMLGRGMKSVQIAHQLKLSPKTVDRHRENIKVKLGLANASELVRRATQWVLENG